MDRDQQHPPCTWSHCDRTAACPPNLRNGQPICPLHAYELAGGICESCGGELDDDPPGSRLYASREGLAFCIDCWVSE